jgi:hypothetical protein
MFRELVPQTINEIITCNDEKVTQDLLYPKMTGKLPIGIEGLK